MAISNSVRSTLQTLSEANILSTKPFWGRKLTSCAVAEGDATADPLMVSAMVMVELKLVSRYCAERSGTDAIRLVDATVPKEQAAPNAIHRAVPTTRKCKEVCRVQERQRSNDAVEMQIRRRITNLNQAS